MRVFVLGTGRCGTVTLSKAFGHATNYTVGHESRAHLLEGRLDYPDQHIEVDNRLSWFVGSLVRRYPTALYVHMIRDKAATVESMVGRPVKSSSMLRAFGDGVVMGGPDFDRTKAAELVYDTINDNISMLYGFRMMRLELDKLQASFRTLWRWVKAEGNLDAAIAELSVKHNARMP